MTLIIPIIVVCFIILVIYLWATRKAKKRYDTLSNRPNWVAYVNPLRIYQGPKKYNTLEEFGQDFKSIYDKACKLDLGKIIATDFICAGIVTSVTNSMKSNILIDPAYIAVAVEYMRNGYTSKSIKRITDQICWILNKNPTIQNLESTILPILHRYNKTIWDMEEHQPLDKVDKVEKMKQSLNKFGSLFGFCFETPAIMSEADPSTLVLLRRIGCNLGAAYAIRHEPYVREAIGASASVELDERLNAVKYYGDKLNLYNGIIKQICESLRDESNFTAK